MVGWRSGRHGNDSFRLRRHFDSLTCSLMLRISEPSGLRLGPVSLKQVRTNANAACEQLGTSHSLETGVFLRGTGVQAATTQLAIDSRRTCCPPAIRLRRQVILRAGRSRTTRRQEEPLCRRAQWAHRPSWSSRASRHGRLGRSQESNARYHVAVTRSQRPRVPSWTRSRCSTYGWAVRPTGDAIMTVAICRGWVPYGNERIVRTTG